VIALGEAHLRLILQAYAHYYNDLRTHRSLDKDAPFSRPVQRTGSITSQALLGGLHHHYMRVRVFGTHTGAMGFTDAHGSESARDDSAVDLIPITDQVARGLSPGECFGDLACDPFRGVGWVVTLIQTRSRRASRMMTKT
jgi:hypothetical protein